MGFKIHFAQPLMNVNVSSFDACLTTDTDPQRDLIQHLCSRVTSETRIQPHTLTYMSLLPLVESQRMFIHKLEKQVRNVL